MRILFCLYVILNAAVFAEEEQPFLKSLFEWINRHRAEHALAPLIWDENLARAALEHSTFMNNKQALSHEGFKNRFQSTRKKICVENVGAGSRTAEDQGEAWRNSPRHDANLLKNEIRYCGLAKAGSYVTFLATD